MTWSTEWRAFATHAAVAWQLAGEGKTVEDRYLKDVAAYASKAAFMHPKSSMFGTTASYIRLYRLHKDPSDADVQRFMSAHEDWIDEAIALHQALRPARIPIAAARNLRPTGVAPADWNNTLGTGTYVLVAAIVAGLVYYFGYASCVRKFPISCGSKIRLGI